MREIKGERWALDHQVTQTLTVGVRNLVGKKERMGCLVGGKLPQKWRMQDWWQDRSIVC